MLISQNFPPIRHTCDVLVHYIRHFFLQPVAGDAKTLLMILNKFRNYKGRLSGFWEDVGTYLCCSDDREDKDVTKSIMFFVDLSHFYKLLCTNVYYMYWWFIKCTMNYLIAMGHCLHGWNVHWIMWLWCATMIWMKCWNYGDDRTLLSLDKRERFDDIHKRFSS